MAEDYVSTSCRLGHHDECRIAAIVPNCACLCHESDISAGPWSALNVWDLGEATRGISGGRPGLETLAHYWASWAEPPDPR